MREQDFIEKKLRYLRSSVPLFAQSGTSCRDILNRMQQEKITCALVLRDLRCIGIFTERDYLTRVLGKGVDLSRPVDDFMSPDPKTLTIYNTVGEAIRLMNEHGYRNIPLLDENGAGVGLLQIRNVIDFLAEMYPEEVLNAPTGERFQTKDGA